MTFQALLFSKDEQAIEILTRVLSGLDVGVVCCEYADAARQLSEQKPDAVLVDFDSAEEATSTLQSLSQTSFANRSITVALLSDKAALRQVLGQGANFVIYKPVTEGQVAASLRAALTVIKRERRRSLRVPLQVPVQIKMGDGPEVEAILLDLSEEGMDILAAQPLSSSVPINARFSLPGSKSELEAHGEVAWTNPNGQAGVRLISPSEGLRLTLRKWVEANAPEQPPSDPDPVISCKLTDLSTGGCYVETESPFPEGCGIVLCLKAEDVETTVEGRVSVMHPGFGMGVEFAARTSEDREAVTRFIEFLTSRPGTIPELSVMPRALRGDDSHRDSATAPDSEELQDPLLELLRKRESLNQEEFLQELHRQRSSPAVESA